MIAHLNAQRRKNGPSFAITECYQNIIQEIQGLNERLCQDLSAINPFTDPPLNPMGFGLITSPDYEDHEPLFRRTVGIHTIYKLNQSLIKNLNQVNTRNSTFSQ